MSWIDEDPKEVAEKIAPYGDIDRGLRKSKPKDENGLIQYVWRMCRFHTGDDMHMPMTAEFWLQDWVEEQGFDARAYGVYDENGKEILSEVSELVDEVIDVFGLDGTKAAKRWNEVGVV